MKRLFSLLLLPVLVSGLAACGNHFKNPELEQYDKKSGYRFDRLQLGENNTDSLFVILALSGGGTRAASFSYGVLQELYNTEILWKGQKKKLIDEIDIISSVSGGSFPAAYYTLFGARIFDGSFETKFLKKDIEKTLFRQLFLPTSWLKLAGTSYGRSDLAADYYHASIFEEATFGTLMARNTRPFLMLNATDMSTGLPFPFIQDRFDPICSDLRGFPVARAVAASSAFPGLLTPLTLNVYSGQCGFEEPRWVSLAQEDRLVAPERARRADKYRSLYRRDWWEEDLEYLHIVDGGVSDNLGLRSILYALESTDPGFSIMQKVNREEIEKLVVIVVNAATDPESTRDSSPRVPGVVDVLTAAATIPLDNYSFDTIVRMQAAIDEYNQAVEIRKSCEKILQNSCPQAALSGGELHEVETYVSHLTFDHIADAKTRFEFRNLPTSFKLPAETVDQLKRTAKQLLQNDADYKRLLQDLQ